MEMAARIMSEGFRDLVDELKLLEDFIPMLSPVDTREELRDDVRELEQLVAVAGEPTDQHSLQALAYLQTELVRKRAILDDM